MKYIARIALGLVLIAVGVGGTLGVQHVMGGTSDECIRMTTVAHQWETALAQDGAKMTDHDFSRLVQVMDIRYKACRDS